MDEVSETSATSATGGGEGRDPPSRPRGRKVTVGRIALAWAVSLGLLAWLTRHVQWGRLGEAVRPTPWWIWLAAAAGIGASYGFRALRIHAELRRRRPLTVGQCLRVMLLHNAAVNVLPMRGGEAAYPLLLQRELAVPLGQGVASLVWIRAQDALVLAIAVVLFLPGLPLALRAAGAVAMLVAVLGLIRLVQRVAARRGAGVEGPRLVRAALAALSALADAPRHGWAGWLFCAGSWAVKLASLGLLLASLSGLAPLDALGGALGGELAGVLPIQGPAGFGTYEAGVWAGASLQGGSALAVAAPAVAVHLLSLLMALAGGALALAFAPASSTPLAGSGAPPVAVPTIDRSDHHA